jgi:hypothetical protein
MKTDAEPLVQVSTRVRPAVAAAIERASQQQRRKRSDIVRLLLEPAVEQELGLAPRQERKAKE